MATEDILIRYRADVSQLEDDINKVIASQQELTSATKANTAEQTKAVNSAEFAAKKRAQLLDQERQKLLQLKEAQKLAFDPTQIDKYNQQIAQSQKRIELLGGTYKQAAQEAQNSNQQLLNGINKIAGAFGVAFSVEALINFSKQAVSAFLDAQEQADKLRFAITSIGGEGEGALARLNAQAQQLAETTFFGDDDITAAQAALSAFGLTADQIESIIPKLTDFAAVTGGTVTDAANTLGGALEGRAGEFKRFGIEVDATSTKAENLAKVTQGLAQQAGAAAAALNTTAGKAKDFKDQAGELVEDIGQGLVTFGTYLGGIFTTYWNVLRDALAPVIDAVVRFKNVIVGLIPDVVIDKLKEFFQGGEALKVVLETIAIPLKLTATLIGKWYDAIVQIVAGISGLVNVFREGFDQIGQTVTSVGSGISDVLNGIANFDTTKIQAGLTKVQGSFSKAGKDIANAFNEGYTSTLKLAEGTKEETDKAVEVAQQAAQKIFTSDELKKKSIQELNIELEKQKKIQGNAARQNVEAIEKELEVRKKQAEAAQKASEEAAKVAEEFKKLINSISGEIAKLESDLAKRKIEIIPAKTFDEQRKRLEGLADLNEKAITDEIAAKIKLVQDDKKLSDQQKNDIIAKYEELKKKRLELARFNEANELNILSKAQLDRINKVYEDLDKLDLESVLTISKEKVETANEAVVKSFEDLSKAINKQDFAAAKEAATLRTNELNLAVEEEAKAQKQILENELKTKNASLSNDAAGNIEREKNRAETDAKILAIDKEKNKQIAKNNQNLTDTLNAQTESYVARWVQANQEILRETVNIVNEINGLFRQATDERIKNIEEQRDAQLAAIDAEIEKNKEYFEDRRISEEQLLASEDALAKERVKIEEETRKKINAQKRKQAQLDKAAAIFEIGINTAIALTNPAVILNPILATLVATTALLQTAAVLAQPIPYRKGSKDTGAKGHMARVGEEGEELVYMPSNSKVLPAKQTRKYGDIIDAMFDNKLDHYIQRNYITPALMAQQNAKEGQRTKTFAENIANSITYNQTGLTASDLEAQRKRGQYIRNVDELADAIAKRIPTRDIYRA